MPPMPDVKWEEEWTCDLCRDLHAAMSELDPDQLYGVKNRTILHILEHIGRGGKKISWTSLANS